MKGEQKDGDKDDTVKEISSVNPIADFDKMTNDRKVDRVGEALTQMMNLIERFIKNSLKGDLYPKAIDCMAAMRKVCIRDDEAAKYNQFLDRVKKVFSRGSYRDFFQQLRQAAGEAKLSLITQKESAISSNVTQQEADAFFQIEDDEDKPMMMKQGAKNDDLMDEIE